MTSEDRAIVVRARGLSKTYRPKRRFFGGRGRAPLTAVDGVDLDIREGEILGLVGESGCGKTTIGHLLARLTVPTSGSVEFEGADISAAEGRTLHRLRKRLQMVFQDPYESVNPRFTVYQTVAEPLLNFGLGGPEERRERVVKALADAGLQPAEQYLERYPHELSGGQLQRVSIARALVIDPRFIIADEPVSMLDVSIRAGVMNLMLDLRQKYGLSYLFITHDMAVARYMCDRIAVMYLGKIVEIGEADDVILKPLHPYTQALLSAVPDSDPDVKHGRAAIKDEMPSPYDLPKGCRFHPRCPRATERCKVESPTLETAEGGHAVACFHPG